MNAVLAFAEQCADADAAKIEQLVRMPPYDQWPYNEWPDEAKLSYINRELCIKHNRVDSYWWLPPEFRPTKERPMWQEHMIEMCRTNAFRCWEKFWSTQVGDRNDAVRQIYWSNVAIPDIVRRDFVAHMRVGNSESCIQIIIMLNDMNLLREMLPTRQGLIHELWYIATCKRPPPLAMLREALPFTNEQSMAKSRAESMALWRAFQCGKTAPTRQNESRFWHFVELRPAKVAVLIGAIAGGWLRHKRKYVWNSLDGCRHRWGDCINSQVCSQDGQNRFRDTQRFFVIATALPNDLQLYLAAITCGTRVLPRDEDLRLVAGVTIGDW